MSKFHYRGVGRVVRFGVLAAMCGCLTDEGELGSDEQEVLVGAFAPHVDDTLRGGGVVVRGASLAGREDGAPNATADIAISGIPAGATVQRALLYWTISGGADTTATINGSGVAGVQVATAGQTCWGADNAVFRADVTARVSGNGTYTIGDLPSGAAPDTDGAALVVVYQSNLSGFRRRVMIRDGAITTSETGEVVTDTFGGVASPRASAGQFHLVVGDGQTFPDGEVAFNGAVVGVDQFPGSSGSLWDVHTYDVAVPAATPDLSWSSQTTGDCLLYATAVLDWTVAVCGDGVRAGGEACDDGDLSNGDGCNAICDVEPGWTCTGSPSVCTTTCGDGVRAGGEACDDGDAMSGDGCSATCAIEPGWTCAGSPSVCTTACGDGVRAGGEACDDGDVMSGDGCSNTCAIEPGWTCTGNTPSVCTTTCGDGIRAGAEACDDGDVMSGDGCSNTCAVESGWTCAGNTPSVCTTTCGDGIRAGAEACDDGDTSSGDGCSNTCAVEPGWTCAGNTPSVCTTTCGDGIRAGAEACDDGDVMSGDGCSNTCAVEPGWTCAGNTPSVCTTTCGDGIRAGAEACDDGDTSGGDGCSMTCTVEPGWTCAGDTPSVCTTTCGDGIRAGAEACDDGDTSSGDGCSMTCTVESGWTCAGDTPSVCTTTCGDGIRAGAEACDDGDTAGGDGCSMTCTVEPGWTCAGDTPDVCVTTCGDGIRAGAEACDDGDTTDGDGCSMTCAVEPGWTCTGNTPDTCVTTCGDGVVAGTEGCDDGDTTADDGCSATCTVEPGWSCTGSPSVCTTGCGDGITAGAETCDDGNTAADDGCSATCTVEPGWTCTDGDPSSCTSVCGDGLLVGAEVCDDGNTDAADGCDATCALEPNWTCTDTAPTECDPYIVAGGGCDAGGGGEGALGLALVLLAGLVGFGRRRRAAAPAVALLVAATGSAGAQALEAGSAAYPVERFQLSMDRDGILGVESARTPGHLVMDLGLWIGYANDPLTLRAGEDRDRLAALVSDRYGGDLTASIGLGKRLELGLSAPLILSQSQDLGSLMSTESLSSFGFGDLRFTPKVALLRGGLDLAFAVAITAPTSGADEYRGDDGLTGAPQLLLGRESGALRFGLGLGWRIRERKETLGLAVDDELFLNAGAGVRAGEKLEVMASLAFATAAAEPFGDFNRNHSELHLGLGFDATSAVRLFAAGGLGLTEGFGTADWRALAGVWIGTPRDEAPEPEPIVEPAPPPADTDGDGKLDPDDACPREAEDQDGFDDDDGCPDDNDQDGVADASDRCPTEAGVAENGGCPDGDRDGDTVVDRLDNCPDEAGDVANGGCKVEQLVQIQTGTLDMVEIIYFDKDRARVKARSYKLLDNVAAVILAHPEITKVTVEGHTSDEGDPGYNKALSQRRAEAVVAYLVKKGIDASKLEAVGYGLERPMTQEAGKQDKNRRVEFKVETSITHP